MATIDIYKNHERTLSIELRYHLIDRLIDFYQPTRNTIDLESRISRLIRRGYVNRNPTNKNYVSRMYQKSNLVIDSRINPHRRLSNSFSIMGFPGMGKTTTIEKILDLYPQIIQHPKPLNVFQIVWIKLNCPYDGSLKTLCMDFFQKIDEIIDTKYFHKFGNPKYSTSAMITNMGHIARLHGLGCIIIDEVQHLLAAKNTEIEKIMNFFVTLNNEVGIPLVMIGTMKAKSIFQKDFRQSRRASGLGDFIWEPYKPSEDDWNTFLDSMWECQLTKKVIPLNDEFKRIIYEESQGILDIAVKLFSLTQLKALELGKNNISPKLMMTVSKQDLQLIKPMIEAIKQSDMDAILMYEDIMPIKLNNLLRNKKDKLTQKDLMLIKKEMQEMKKKEQSISKVTKLIDILCQVGVEPKDAENIAIKLLKKHPEKEISNLLQMAMNETADIEAKNQKAVKDEINNLPNELKRVVDQGKQANKSAYDSLLFSGYIFDPLSELFF